MVSTGNDVVQITTHAGEHTLLLVAKWSIQGNHASSILLNVYAMSWEC